MKPTTHVAAYRHLTRLYPRSFRAEYRVDLLELFSHQLEDDGPGRVWLRTTRDMAVTVPTQHLEAHMHRPVNNLVTTASTVIAVAAVLLTVTTGTPVSMVFLLVAAGAGAVAYWSWQANRAFQVASTACSLWWKFLVGGVALAIVTFSATAIPWPDAVDLGESAYWVVVFSVMTALALGVIGLVLGITAIVHRKTSPGIAA